MALNFPQMLTRFLQRILSTDYTSFSMFGLCFTYILGVLVIIFSYLLEPIEKCLRRRKTVAEYTRSEWAATETLQLQRTAFQGLGTGTWTGYTNVIPKTQKGEMLGDLVLSYTNGSTLAVSTPSAEKLGPVITHTTSSTTEVPAQIEAAVAGGHAASHSTDIRDVKEPRQEGQVPQDIAGRQGRISIEQHRGQATNLPPVLAQGECSHFASRDLAGMAMKLITDFKREHFQGSRLRVLA